MSAHGAVPPDKGEIGVSSRMSGLLRGADSQGDGLPLRVFQLRRKLKSLLQLSENEWTIAMRVAEILRLLRSLHAARQGRPEQRPPGLRLRFRRTHLRDGWQYQPGEDVQDKGIGHRKLVFQLLLEGFLRIFALLQRQRGDSCRLVKDLAERLAQRRQVLLLQTEEASDHFFPLVVCLVQVLNERFNRLEAPAADPRDVHVSVFPNRRAERRDRGQLGQPGLELLEGLDVQALRQAGSGKLDYLSLDSIAHQQAHHRAIGPGMPGQYQRGVQVVERGSVLPL